MDTDSFDDVNQVLDRAAQQFDVRAGREQFWARVDRSPVIGFSAPRQRRPWAVWGSGVVVAALLIAAATFSMRRVIATQSGAPGVWREFATGRGERATVRLADGSQVMLAPESRLREPRRPGAAREVTLEGEAVFTVVHDPVHPFRVRVGNTVTEDIGTRFDIRAYPEDHSVRVVVAEGEVALQVNAQQATDLRAGTLAEVSGVGTTSVTPAIAADRYLSWTDDRLAFDHIPLGAVLATLSRWYGIDFQVSDSSLAKQPFTLELDHATASHAEDVIGFLAHARVRQAGSVVTFVPDGTL